MATILSHPFFTEQILPFLLVFTLIFAILDRIKILGEGKRQINAIVAFVIGLLLIAFPFPRSIIVNLMPLLAVTAVILLVFMLLYGFVGGGELKGEKWMKITFGILIGLALLIALLVFTNYWNVVVDAVTGGRGGEIATNILFIAIIIAAIAVVLSTGKGGGGGESSE
jgi:hypothetical protein